MAAIAVAPATVNPTSTITLVRVQELGRPDTYSVKLVQVTEDGEHSVQILAGGISSQDVFRIAEREVADMGWAPYGDWKFFDVGNGRHELRLAVTR